MNTRNSLNRRKLYRQFLLALALLALTAPLGAQVEASITGTVTDNSGGAIPGAAVTVTNVENGFTRQVKADAAGRYGAASLPLGRYDVTAEMTGFRSEVKTGLTLVVGEKAVVDLTLQVGAVKQVVTVKEEGPVVNVTSQETSGLVGERQVKELPLNGRSYDELMTLNPGIVNFTGERTGGVGVSNSAVGNMFAVSGRRPQENLFLLNGIEYTGASEINLTPGGASGELLGVDAVREFNVLTDTYGAEYGKRSGAQVNIVTASGANQLHGTMYEFLRNSALDARNFFDQGSTPQFERNEFGGALGGPIQKDKTFIFGNYEGFRQDLGLSDVTLVPDNNARRGLLPGSNGALENVGITPAVQPFLALWPVQNGPDLGGGIGEAFSHPQQTIREDFGTTRLDHAFSGEDSLFGVYTVDDSDDTTPTANPLSLDLESLREQVASLQETHVFSSTALNTARFGYSRGAYLFNGQSLASAPSFIQGAPVGAIVVGGGTAVNAASQISLAGTNVGSNFIAARNLFTYEDRVDVSKGAHQLSVGAWFQRIQANDNMAQGQYGQASFSSLATFLQGAVSTFTAVPSPTLMGWRSLEGAVYFQDAIKLKRNLELTLGLRDEFTNGWNEAHGRASNYVFTNGVINTQPTVGNSVFTVNNARFLPEPRVGLAWDPFGKGKTVVHAGFGLYHALLDDLSYRLDQNPPFNTTLTLKNAPISSLNLAPGAPLPSGGLISPAGVQPDAETPAVVAYTFKIEQQIAPRTLLSVGYVGSRGAHEMLAADTNEPVPTICPAAPCPARLAAGTVYYPKNAPFANPQLSNTTTWLSEGESSYNALEVDVNHHFDHGLQLRGVYTYSKSLDDGGAWNSSVAANSPGFVMFPLDPRLDWGLSPFDIRHLVAINGSYDLPFGYGKPFVSRDGWEGKLISGWTVSGIETLQSGFPFTPQLGFNPTNNGDSRNPVRPSYNPAFQGNIILGGPTMYFNPNAYIAPANGTYGNVGRDTLIGPGLASLDFSLSKNTQISEKVRLQFRAEFFNLLNRANFNTPNAVVYTAAASAPSPTAGVINSTATTSRQIQFGLKLIW
ncbi:MAG: carboxypeptidase regulatory-like domain-containing protein [Terriglobia bacterium]